MFELLNLFPRTALKLYKHALNHLGSRQVSFTRPGSLGGTFQPLGGSSFSLPPSLEFIGNISGELSREEAEAQRQTNKQTNNIRNLPGAAEQGLRGRDTRFRRAAWQAAEPRAPVHRRRVGVDWDTHRLRPLQSLRPHRHRSTPRRRPCVPAPRPRQGPGSRNTASLPPCLLRGPPGARRQRRVRTRCARHTRV